MMVNGKRIKNETEFKELDQIIEEYDIYKAIRYWAVIIIGFASTFWLCKRRMPRNYMQRLGYY